MCGTSEDLTVDHIDPATKGRADLTLADVQVLCRSHNSSKGANASVTRQETRRDDEHFVFVY